jgi:hypothetical protein
LTLTTAITVLPNADLVIWPLGALAFVVGVVWLVVGRLRGHRASLTPVLLAVLGAITVVLLIPGLVLALLVLIGYTLWQIRTMARQP